MFDRLMTHVRGASLGAIGVGAWRRDLRHGVRALAGSPRFTLVALLTIVLMVAAITTIFTLVHGVLLRPLPYPEDDRLLFVESTQPNGFGTTVTLPDALAFQEQSRSFDLWGLYRVGYVEMLPDAKGEPRTVHDILITPDLFPMLGTRTVLGRALRPSDSAPAAPDVTVISYELWQTLFAGDRDVVGRSISIRERPVTVIGVAGQGADVPKNWLTYPIIWRPVRSATDDRFMTLARLRPDASVQLARAELTLVAERLAADHPDTHQGRAVTVTPLLDEIVGDFQRLLWIFFGAVTCVLLIGAGNLASLQLARNGAREREIGLRAALGASRWQIVRQLVVESVLLSILGGAVGLAVARLAVDVLATTLPAGFPRADQVTLDAGVALFACGVSLVIGLIVGCLPAWQASRVDGQMRLNEAGRAATLGAERSRMQRTLIAFQTSAALILLIGAGLLANSFYRLISRDAGMREEGLWAVTATLPSRYGDEAAQNAFWTSALDRIRALPSVESATVSVNATQPLSGNDLSTRVAPSGVGGSSEEDFRISYRRVSDGYFATIGMPLLEGRPILESDSAGTEKVVVVNELAAAGLFPGQSPIGKRVQWDGEPMTVVGVIPTFRHARLRGESAPQMYTPYLQQARAAAGSVIMFRAKSGSTDAAAAVRSLLTALEKDLEVNISTMGDARWKLLANERFRVAVLLTFAGSAVFLALVGIFGLVAYTVGQRQREIAVRLALGAVRRDIMRVAGRHAIYPAFIGLALGVAGATAATRLLSSFLVDIEPVDLPTFAAALGLLALASLAAVVLPARQALAIDPVEALRAE